MNAAARTAIGRTRPSAPSAKLVSTIPALTDPTVSVLDYGCGRGFDADNYGWTKYDPYHGPPVRDGHFDIIVCNYVLNVISEVQAEKVVADIFERLGRFGVAYITVRRDMKPDQYAGVQRHVVLDLPIFFEKKGCYVTYVLDRHRQVYRDCSWQV